MTSNENTVEELRMREQMMQARLCDERAIIFTNLLNGVPVWQVARDFHKQAEGEVMAIFRHIVRKIRSYCFERKLPPVLGETIADIRRYRITCLQILPKINLDKEPRFAKIFDETMKLRDDGSFTNQNVLKEIRA